MFSWNKFKKALIQEITERLPWAFISYIAGILGYCFFENTPNLFVLLGLILGAGLLWILFRKKEILSWGITMIFFFLLGLGNISSHIALKHHPVLTHPLYQEHIEATVSENRPLIEKQIVTLEKIHWRNPDLKMPKRIRVHYKENELLLKRGDNIKATVSVYPPDGQWKQNLWFQEIGATGIASKVQVTQLAPEEKVTFSNIRYNINQHLFQILPYSQAEIAAPLITGEQKLVSPETYQTYRRAGIAHVLSVSGFHMALLATFLFFLIRGISALFPRIVLYYNTKKVAAVVALIGTFLYLGLSGFQIPAVRAFIMILLVFLGILIDRSVLSMRSLLLAGLGMLLIMPQMLFSVSFQLSFTAVAVLVKVCHFVQNRSWPHFMKVITGFLMLNVFVFFALAPFILYHFQQFTPYGILGNMIFNTLFSFFIMPLLFMGTLMIPLGIDKAFFILVGFGLDIVHMGAKKIAFLPNAEMTISEFSSTSLILISFGIMQICFMKTALKWMGLIWLMAGIIMGFFT